ncbi:hypothetical protein PQR46_14230 [Paraburkholderia sediminicola]|uniref:hypothetical protein n=1 Tax=Paraburkholderia TaxID=1822464 RepID=UPI0038BAC493
MAALVFFDRFFVRLSFMVYVSVILVNLWLAVSQSTLIAHPADGRTNESNGAAARRAGEYGFKFSDWFL